MIWLLYLIPAGITLMVICLSGLDALDEILETSVLAVLCAVFWPVVWLVLWVRFMNGGKL